MNFSTRVRYGTRAMIDIAHMSGTEGGVTIAAVASSQQLSRKYLENLLVKLRKAGLLNSLRGKNGGYRLALNPEEITVLNIVEALDGPLNLVDCHQNATTCPREDFCETAGLWSHLTGTLTDEMKRITLKDLQKGNI